MYAYQLRRQVLDSASDLIAERDEVLVRGQGVLGDVGCGGCGGWRLPVLAAVGRPAVAQKVAQVAARGVLDDDVQRTYRNVVIIIMIITLISRRRASTGTR